MMYNLSNRIGAFAKKCDFVTFGLGGHVTLWLAISPQLNILRRLTHQNIGN